VEFLRRAGDAFGWGGWQRKTATLSGDRFVFEFREFFGKVDG
jgi:hypothetical protein